MLIAERLLHEVKGPSIHCMDGHRSIAVSENQKDRGAMAVEMRFQYPAKSSIRMSSSLMPMAFSTLCRPATIAGGPAI